MPTQKEFLTHHLHSLSSLDEGTCPICYEDWNNQGLEVIVLECSDKHWFHRECLLRWTKHNDEPMHSTCPYYRHKLFYTTEEIEDALLVQVARILDSTDTPDHCESRFQALQRGHSAQTPELVRAVEDLVSRSIATYALERSNQPNVPPLLDSTTQFYVYSQCFSTSFYDFRHFAALATEHGASTYADVARLSGFERRFRNQPDQRTPAFWYIPS
ncbi:hypothetical protein P154DRAFT_572242 [Amniculicola lignicola CBS 123094]|uniref:RING-type domain-containing protein n=1 Tax=Amniculicola lignicola CBS 123094 TaxID=1392246 RepID=A0A6A5WT13_9PLEO|nr:hypothetical protein P154DRAFT_572242 [Amniculicola lignicola CBS 123094]